MEEDDMKETDRFGFPVKVKHESAACLCPCTGQKACSIRFATHGAFQKRRVLESLAVLCTIYLFLWWTSWVHLMIPSVILNEERAILCTCGNISTGEGFQEGFIQGYNDAAHMKMYLYVKSVTRKLQCIKKMHQEEVLNFDYRLDYLNVTEVEIEQQLSLLLAQYPPGKTFDAWHYPYSLQPFGVEMTPPGTDPGPFYYIGWKMLVHFIILCIAFYIAVLYIALMTVIDNPSDDTKCSRMDELPY